MRIASLSLVSVLVLAAPRERAAPPFPLLPELGGQHLAVTPAPRPRRRRTSTRASSLYWGFDHEEASRSFERARELDPRLRDGATGASRSRPGRTSTTPTMDAERDSAPRGENARAGTRSAATTPVERALIDALATRYAWPPPERPPAARRGLRGGDARGAGTRIPDDADVGALFAESLMDLRPWDLWTNDGEPKAGTPTRSSATLERVLALDGPNHPGANHLYIHAVGGVAHARERARDRRPAARRSCPAPAPRAHAGAHLHARRTATTTRSARTSARSRSTSARSRARCRRRLLRASTCAHNCHFLVYAAMFEGRYELALASARELVRELPRRGRSTRSPEFVDGFLPTPLHVLVRFGKWDEILAEPEPAAEPPRHASRSGTTRAGSRSRRSAASTRPRASSSAFEAACAAVPESYTIGNNPTRTVLDIGRSMLAGELEYRAAATSAPSSTCATRSRRTRR